MKTLTTRLFGFPIIFHWSTLVMFILLTINVYPYSNGDIWHASLVGALYSLGIYVIVLAHELGHCYAGKALGYRINKVTLMALGGVAEIIGSYEFRPKHELIITIFGPLVNVAFAIAGIMLNPDKFMFYLQHHNVVFELEYYWQLMIMTNMVMFIFNMIPIFPMDGGRIMRASISLISGDYHKSTKIANYISLGFISVVGYYFITIGAITGAIIMGIMLYVNVMGIKNAR